MKAGILSLMVAGWAALAEALPAYTNHAGLAAAGVPVALTAKTVTLSNSFERMELPLSIFPERERREGAGVRGEVTRE